MIDYKRGIGAIARNQQRDFSLKLAQTDRCLIECHLFLCWRFGGNIHHLPIPMKEVRKTFKNVAHLIPLQVGKPCAYLREIRHNNG